jgi:hypothetical protein
MEAPAMIWFTNWRAWLIICAVTWLVLTLVGCATVTSQTVRWTACDGTPHSAWVQVRRSLAPTLDCAAAYAEAGSDAAALGALLIMPIGCAVPLSGGRWIVVVDPFALVLGHEMQHIMGERHWVADTGEQPCSTTTSTPLAAF